MPPPLPPESIQEHIHSLVTQGEELREQVAQVDSVMTMMVMIIVM